MPTYLRGELTPIEIHMAITDYSIGFTTSEVEEILAVQKAELKKTLAAYANDGSTVTKLRIDVPRSAATTRPGRAIGTGSIVAVEGLYGFLRALGVGIKRIVTQKPAE